MYRSEGVKGRLGQTGARGEAGKRRENKFLKVSIRANKRNNKRMISRSDERKEKRKVKDRR